MDTVNEKRRRLAQGHWRSGGGAGLAKALYEDRTKWVPNNVLWAARVAMFVVGYTYHCPNGVLRIAWAVLSLVLEAKLLLLVSISAWLPLLFWEFALVYASRIPGVSWKERHLE